MQNWLRRFAAWVGLGYPNKCFAKFSEGNGGDSIPEKAGDPAGQLAYYLKSG